jgi:hypothetical protein
MLDLFGDTITAPTSVPAKGVLNAAAGFAEFWAAWPSTSRKVAKQQCLNKWASYGCADNMAHILAHVEWMKTQPDWQKDGGSFICAPMVYLNQQRWVDWVAPKPVPRQPDALQKILSHKGAPMPRDIKARLDAQRKSIVEKQGAQA